MCEETRPRGGDLFIAVFSFSSVLHVLPFILHYRLLQSLVITSVFDSKTCSNLNVREKVSKYRFIDLKIKTDSIKNQMMSVEFNALDTS